MQKTHSFKKKLIATTIASYALAGLTGAAFAQESTDNNIEEVLVLGVKGAQKSAVEAKREAQSIVDGISAEDIGKLPDTTISDSLQRITGVQIQRDAGEGGSLSIRGLQQVALLLNGEQFLSAGNITAAQPNLNDIPAQLLHGSQVYKSLDVRNAQSGITGTINIQTFRPLDFKNEGLSAAAGLDVSTGDITNETDPTLNALVNWRNDKIGMMLSGVTGVKNLANNFAGSAAFSSEARQFSNGSYTVVDSHGFDFFNQAKERHRDGLNAALQADLGEGFQFVAEAFYTHAKTYDRQIGLDISNRWLGEQNAGSWLDANNGWHGSATAIPTNSVQTATGKDGRTWFTANKFDIDALWINTYSINNVTTSDSKNFNFELNYDNGGAFTGSVRAIKAEASSLDLHANGQGDFSNWQDNNTLKLNTFYPAYIAKNFTPDTRHTELGVKGGYYVNPNPQGYGEDPQLSLGRNNFNMYWGGFDRQISGGLGAGKTLTDYFANKDSQAIGAYALEGNHDNQSSLDALNLKGKYTFDDNIITDVEVGLRKSGRSVSTVEFHMFSNFYAGSSNYATSPLNASENIIGCGAQWKAIDQQFDGAANHSQCSAGERLVGRENDETSFTPYTINAPTKIDAFGAKLKWVTDLGTHVKGIPGFWAIDPKTFDDPIAFHMKAFGGANRVINPGNSYDIKLDELSSYAMANFKTGIVSGNLGLRIIETELKANEFTTTGQSLANGNTTISNGRVVETKKNTEVLPALNLAVEVTDELKVRFAAAKTKQDLDLSRYGSSLSISTAPDVNNPGVRIPSGWSSNGNINLKPWLATNIDLSAEYYFGDASMVSLGIYDIKVDSYVTNKHFNRDFVLNGKPYTLVGDGPIEGKGGKIHGVEIGTKLAFSDITSGFLADFGVDANYTYSPSETVGGNSDISGKVYPFPNNSEKTYNLAFWYQKDALQARIALNNRSDRYVGDNGQKNGFATYELGSTFIDLNVSYDVIENVTVYLQGSNITGVGGEQVYRLANGIEQDANAWDNEARYSLGVRAKF